MLLATGDGFPTLEEREDVSDSRKEYEDGIETYSSRRSTAVSAFGESESVMLK